MVLVDTNVVVDVWQHEADWSAAVLGCAILTRDAARYRSYFPTVELTPRS